jgi:cell filamentation protein, protein adenylyltransferase
LIGYEVFDDPYCYKGTFVLKNRARTRDAAALEAFEVEMSTLRAQEPLPLGRFGTAHYSKVHHHLFQDVYRWAGHYRTVRTGKDGNWFCYPENIPRFMKEVFAKLAAQPFRPGSEPTDFVAAAADFLAELNAVHPFREGNGRSQLAFLHLVAIRADHPMRLDKIRRATFLPAMIASFAGNLDPLIAELGQLLG